MKKVTKIYKRIDEAKYEKGMKDNEYIDSIMGDETDSYPVEVKCFDDWDSAKAELKNYENIVTKFLENKIVRVEVYYIQEVEIDEDGEEINWEDVYYFS